MRKIAIVAALTLSLTAAARPADASRCGRDCLPWLTPIAVGLGAGIAGAYAYGTGVYIVGDLDGTVKSTNYYGSELILHGSIGSVFVGGTIDTIRNGSVGGTIVMGSFAAIHLTLATNGLRGLVKHSGEFHPNETLVTWTVGTVTGINALGWASGMSERHGRSYGLAEIAINAPFVAGYAHLAKDRFESGAGGPGLVYAGLAAISTLYVAHGAKTALFPYRAPKLDMFGADVAPAIVSDSRGEIAPGLATAGTF
jgi:hypothetical protein